MMKVLKKIDKPLLIVSIILFAIGLITIYSASNVTAYMLNDANPGRYFIKEAGFILGGFLVCLFGLRVVSTKKYSAIAWFATIGITGLIIAITLIGQVVNGMSAWINYNGFGIQPSEFAKISIIPLIAFFYDRHYKYRNNFKLMMVPMGIAMVVAGSIVFQGDLGTAIIFVGLCGLMFFISPVSNRIKIRVFGIFLIFAAFIGILLLSGANILPENKLARFNLYDPCSRYITTANQLCNSYIAINGGGLTGKGLGNSTQKYLYLPEAHTDFIFAIYVEELGLIGAIVLIALYFVLLVRIIVIGKMAPTIAKKMICYGVSFYLFMHVIVNLTGVLGILPMTGVPLPFMSYGGSICLCTLLALTMVERIAYENNSKNLKKS